MMDLLSLPDELLEKILSYSSYDEISQLRLVCKHFNFVCQNVLNQGFYKAEKYHSKCLRNVKSQLPRRESERRKHPLARHCEVLTAVETRISLLNMTFMKYVESKCCCFIPGKVLDEIFKVLHYVASEHTMIRTHELLQELRDISSMAMEHFDEKIAPGLKKCNTCSPKLSVNRFGELAKYQEDGTATHHHYNYDASYETRIETRLNKLSSNLKIYNKKHNLLAKDMVMMQQKYHDEKRKSLELAREVGEQQNLIATQAAKIEAQQFKIEDLNRKLTDLDKIISAFREQSNSRNEEHETHLHCSTSNNKRNSDVLGDPQSSKRQKN